MAALMEFAPLVELTIIRQLKLEWVCVSVWPASAGDPDANIGIIYMSA